MYLVTNAASAIVWTLVFGLGAYYAGPPILDLAGMSALRCRQGSWCSSLAWWAPRSCGAGGAGRWPSRGAPADCQPTGRAPPDGTLIAIVCADSTVKAPGVRTVRQIWRALAPHSENCCAPTAPGIVA